MLQNIHFEYYIYFHFVDVEDFNLFFLLLCGVSSIFGGNTNGGFYETQNQVFA
jgi:hypothetical protein